MIKLKNDGYVFISKNGIEYDLLEGVTIGATKQYTSDIIFVMLSNGLRYDINDCYVGHIYGAKFFPKELEEYDLYFTSMVEEFEKKHNLKEEENNWRYYVFCSFPLLFW